MVTVDHIRFARVNQLARLLDIPDSHASAILAGKGISEKVLNRGSGKGISIDVLLNGISLKRQDLLACKKLQAELQQVLEAV